MFKEFQPQLVVYNAGTDILEGDPLGYMCITPEVVMVKDSKKYYVNEINLLFFKNEQIICIVCVTRTKYA